MIERPAREGRSEKRRPEYRHKKTFIPGKSENEGIQGILLRTRGTGWPHPSLDGEVGPALRDRDEHNQADILTSGLKPHSRLPGSAVAEPVALGVRNPLQWRNRPRFSRGSLTPGYDEDGPIVHRFQRTHDCYRREAFLPREIF